MPTIIDTALCIRRWDFSETSQTVSLFTREHGVIRGLAKGAKREKGRFSGGLDVLTTGQVVAIVKPGRDLATITEWHLQETHRAVRQSLEANRAALYMVDLVHHMLTGHDPHPRLFDALTQSLERLEVDGEADIALLLMQWTVLDETGYRPVLDRDAETREELPDGAPTLAFSPRAGGVVHDSEGPDRWRVRRTTIELLRKAAANEPLDGLDAEGIRRANRLLAAYCREIIGSELPTMQWAFSDLPT